MAEDKVSFATHLTHQFNLVDAQVQSGLYVIKRTSAYLRKIVQAQGECAIALDKATKNEGTKIAPDALTPAGRGPKKVSALQKDGMANHVTAVCSLQSIFDGVVNKYREFGQKVTTDVVAPLLEFLKTGEKRRKDILAKEQKATKNLRAQYDKLRRARAQGQATWDEIQRTNKEMSAAGDLSAKNQKLSKKLDGLKSKAKKDFQIYEKLTAETFSQAQEYFNSSIPDLLKQLEEIEKDRLQLLKAQLALFAKLYNIWDSPTTPGNSYIETVNGLDAKTDMHKCIISRVSEVGLPQGPPELPPALPCSANAFDSDSWKTPTPPEMPQFGGKGDVKTVPGTHARPSFAGFDDPIIPERGEKSEPAHTVEVKSSSEPSTIEESAEPASTIKDVGEDAALAEGEAEGPVQFARAVYDYATDHSDDLQFKVGDIIRLITTVKVDFSTHDPSNPVWLLGELRDNPEKTGSFPSNYVEEYIP